MGAFEMHTASLLVGVLYIVMPTFAWLVLGEARNRAAALWCIGGLALGIATILVSAFSGSAHRTLALTLPSFLWVVSYVLRVQALRLDMGNPHSRKSIVMFLAVFALIYEYLLRVVDLYVPRAMFASFAFLAGSAALMWHAIQIAKLEKSKMAYWIALAYGSVALAFALRMLHLTQQDYSRVVGSVVADGTASVVIAIVMLLASVIGHFGYVGLVLERSQRKTIHNAEERIRAEVSQRLGAQIAVLERRNSLGQMAASIGHELNQPLTAILSNAQLAKRGLQSGRMGSETVQQLLDKVDYNTQRAAKILERIRDFMRATPPQHEPVDLHKLVQDVLALLEGDLRKQKVSIEIKSPQEPVLVYGDALQISQVLLNLLRNALDSMAEESERRLRILCAHSDGRGRLAVRDWGAGVSDAHQVQLGTPFFTTKPQGLGMGLAISQTIVRNHGGSLTLGNAQDGQGAGALAVLELPLAQTKASA